VRVSIEITLRYGKVIVKQVTNKDFFDPSVIGYIKKTKRIADSQSIRE